MKTIVFILCILFNFVLKAQYITPTVQNCGGVSMKTAKVNFSFVVGQSFVAVGSKNKANIIENITIGKLYAGSFKKTKLVKSSLDVKLYPNPAADHVKIAINNKNEGQVFRAQLLDMMGRQLAAKQTDDSDIQNETILFDVSIYPTGQYLFRVYATDDIQNVHIFKVVKIPN